jgi:uncharacterized protein (DUF302 family)
MEFGLTKISDLSFEDMIIKVTEELKKESFVVITTIDIQNTIKQKINRGFRRYTILGACNPQFSYEALLTNDRIGLLMPCNVVVQEKEGKTEILIFDPSSIKLFVNDQKLIDMAEELSGKLKRVLMNL